MDALQQFDAGIFSTLNGFHAYYFDSFMYLVTKIATWIPMILMLLYLLFIKKGWRKAIAIVLAIGLVILTADQVSASIIKPLVARARPSHNPDLASTIHIVNGYRGGPFGFVSSHAANCFGIALLLAMIFKNRLFTWTMVVWAALMCYSRIYLGVHYPLDILMGALWGVLCGVAVYALYCWLSKRFVPTPHHISSFFTATGYRRTDLIPILGVFPVTFVYIIIRAAVFAASS